MKNLKDENNSKIRRDPGRSRDLSLWFLLFSNIVTIFLAMTENWNLSTIIWVYWFQGITIGFFNFIRILQLREFSTENFEINNRPVQPTKATKLLTAFFFLFHFGSLHLAYLAFLLAEPFNKVYGNTPNLAEVKYAFLNILLFFINHLFSYFYNKPRDTKKLNIGSLMFYPYARIIPMYTVISIILFTSSFRVALPLFLVLKTIADSIMHVVEHSFLRKGELELQET